MTFRPDPRDTRRHGVVYLVCFDERYKHAKHYLGFCEMAADRVERRMVEHMIGRGSNLLRVVTGAGIPWRLTRLWLGTRADERRLKNGGSSVRYCPRCTPRPQPIRFLEALDLDETAVEAVGVRMTPTVAEEYAEHYDDEVSF